MFYLKGFEKSRFTVPVSSVFECSFCVNIARAPRQCSSEHIFCLDCITESLMSHAKCPKCPIKLTSRTLALLPKKVRVEYDSLILKCAAEVTGCKFTGTISQIVNHEKTCDFVLGNWPNIAAQVAAENRGRRQEQSSVSSVIPIGDSESNQVSRQWPTEQGLAEQQERRRIRGYTRRQRVGVMKILIVTMTGTAYSWNCHPQHLVDDVKDILQDN